MTKNNGLPISERGKRVLRVANEGMTLEQICKTWVVDGITAQLYLQSAERVKAFKQEHDNGQHYVASVQML